MRTMTLAAAGAALFAAGAAAGWLLAARSPEAAPAPAPAPEAPAAAGPAARSDADASPAAPTAATAKPRPLPGAAPGVALATGSLQGTVRTDKGEPLAGVEVVLRPRYPAERQRADTAAAAAAGDASARAEVESRRIGWEEEARRTASTDGAGAFRFEGVPDVLLLLEPRKSGWRFQRASGPGWGSPEVRIGQRVDLEATEAVDVHVEVRLPDGSLAEEASLRTGSAGASTVVAWYPGSPVVPLPVGTYEVTASSSLLRSDPQQVEVRAGGEPATLRFDLRSRPGLRGHLSYPGRQGPMRAIVFLLRAPASGEVTPTMVRTLGQEGMAIDRTRWEFSFPDLAPGRHFLAVFADPNGESPASHMQEVVVGDSLAEVEVPVPLPERSRYLKLRVLGPGGAPVRAPRIQAYYLEDGKARASCSEPALADDGSWILAPDRSMDRVFDASTMPLDVTKGLFRVSATADAYGAAAIEARPGPAAEAEIRFAAPGSLSVSIDGYVGSALQGRLRVTLDSAEGAASPVQLYADGRTLHSEGRARFDAAQPGEYVLNLSLGSGRGGWWNVAKQPVTVGAAKGELRVALPALYSVRITGAKWRVGLRRTDDPKWWASTNLPGPDGILELDGLPAGDYQIEEQGKKLTFTLPGTGEVNLTEAKR